MERKVIYVVTYRGLDDEQGIIRAYDTEQDAIEAVKNLGHSEIIGHDYEEVSLFTRYEA